jgi:hypothetical protein
MSTASPFVVLSRGEKRRVLHEAVSLPAARSFVEGCKRPSEILIRAQQCGSNTEDLYVLCIIDGETGQILAQGPTMHICDAGDVVLDSRLALLPLCVVSGGGIR